MAEHCHSFLVKNILINKCFVTKSLHTNIVCSEKFRNKIRKNTKKLIKNSTNCSCYINKPSNRRKQWRLNRDSKNNVREELKDHQKKVTEIIRSQLRNTNERLYSGRTS